MGYPCKFDHNGECLICDCWIDSCAYGRHINGDYIYENKDELNEMFSNISSLEKSLDWWKQLPTINTVDKNDSWSGYVSKHYPEKTDVYRLTDEEILYIWINEKITEI